MLSIIGILAEKKAVGLLLLLGESNLNEKLFSDKLRSCVFLSEKVVTEPIYY